MKKVKFATSLVTPPGANIRSNMTGHAPSSQEKKETETKTKKSSCTLVGSSMPSNEHAEIDFRGVHTTLLGWREDNERINSRTMT